MFNKKKKKKFIFFKITVKIMAKNTAVLGLLVVVMVALIGGVGYYIYDIEKKKKKNAAPSPSPSSPTPVTPPVTPGPSETPCPFGVSNGSTTKIACGPDYTREVSIICPYTQAQRNAACVQTVSPIDHSEEPMTSFPL